MATPGIWYMGPSECGPYAPSGTVGVPSAPAGSATDAMSVWTRPFDLTAAPATGDLWQASVNPAVLGTFAPVTANPGQTVTINVAITPSGPSGSVVRGDLFVDAVASGIPTAVFQQVTADELTAIPYEYRIK